LFNHICHDFPSLLQETIAGTRHYITPDGNRYPSVTTVLQDYSKKGIDEWKKRVGTKTANRISKQATDRGTSVHAAIEKLIKNENMSDVVMMPHAKAVYIPMKQEVMKMDNIHALETKMFSHELELAGTVDCIAEYDGVLTVIDFKTSKRMKKREHVGNYFMQGAAYAVMFEEMTGIPIDDIAILIGVDGHNFPQVLRTKATNHLTELKFYITKYKERMTVC